MPIKTSSAKAKGRNLQKKVKEILHRFFPKLQEDDIQSRAMGSQGVDLMLSPEAQRQIGLSIECKNTKANVTMKDINQSKNNAYKGSLPVVIHKPHRAEYEDAIMICKFKDFLEWKTGGNMNGN